MSRIVWIVLVAAACAPAGGVSTPGSSSPVLAWNRASSALRYQVADTSNLTLSIPGMGEAPVDVGSVAVVELSLREGTPGLEATATVTELTGRFSSPAGAPLTVGAADVPPPARIHVAPDGEVTLRDVAPFTGGLAQVTSPANLYRSLFPALPGAAARVGAEWTDTVRVAESQAGMNSETTQIIRSTWARDSVVGGRSVAVIETRMTTEIRISGSNQGVAIEQQLSGSSSGITLWDPAASVLVERRETGTATGSASLPGLGMEGIPVSARLRQHIRLLSR